MRVSLIIHYVIVEDNSLQVLDGCRSRSRPGFIMSQRAVFGTGNCPVALYLAMILGESLPVNGFSPLIAPGLRRRNKSIVEGLYLA